MTELLHDSGRVPLAVRIPCLLLGVVSLVLCADIACRWAFNAGIPFLAGGQAPMGRIPALAATLVLGLFMLNWWFARRRILLDSELGQILIKCRWLFGRSCQRIPIASIASIRIQCFRGIVRQWYIQAMAADGRDTWTWLTSCFSAKDADAVAGRISRAIDRPVTHY